MKAFSKAELILRTEMNPSDPGSPEFDTVRDSKLCGDVIPYLHTILETYCDVCDTRNIADVFLSVIQGYINPRNAEKLTNKLNGEYDLVSFRYANDTRSIKTKYIAHRAGGSLEIFIGVIPPMWDNTRIKVTISGEWSSYVDDQKLIELLESPVPKELGSASWEADIYEVK